MHLLRGRGAAHSGWQGPAFLPAWRSVCPSFPLAPSPASPDSHPACCSLSVCSWRRRVPAGCAAACGSAFMCRGSRQRGLGAPCPLGLGPLAARAAAGRGGLFCGTGWCLQELPRAAVTLMDSCCPRWPASTRESSQGPGSCAAWLTRLSLGLSPWRRHKGQTASPATSSSPWSHLWRPRHQPGSWGFTPDSLPLPAAPGP